MMPSAKKSRVKAVVRALMLPTTMAEVKAALTRKLTRATASPSTRGPINRSTSRTAGLRQSGSGRNCAPSPRRPRQLHQQMQQRAEYGAPGQAVDVGIPHLGGARDRRQRRGDQQRADHQANVVHADGD